VAKWRSLAGVFESFCELFPNWGISRKGEESALGEVCAHGSPLREIFHHGGICRKRQKSTEYHLESCHHLELLVLAGWLAVGATPANLTRQQQIGSPLGV
jgi:hypothetical protein